VSWRFARTPKWIVRHVLVAVLVFAMVQAGLWQLRRLDEKREIAARVEARADEPPVALTDEVLPVDAAVDGDEVDALEHRRATVVGTYRHEDTVVVENRTYNGASGAWVLTPLLDEEGTAVLVLRGFIGFDADGRIVAPEPPAGEVAVEGFVQESQRRGRLGPTDPEGRLDVLARADVERFAQQVDYLVRPVYLQLISSDPPEPAPAEGAPQLVPLDPPSTGEGPHLSYAVQWFTFSTIGVVGYAVLLRRVAIDEAKAERADGAAAGPPD